MTGTLARVVDAALPVLLARVHVERAALPQHGPRLGTLQLQDRAVGGHVERQPVLLIDRLRTEQRR